MAHNKFWFISYIYTVYTDNTQKIHRMLWIMACSLTVARGKIAYVVTGSVDIRIHCKTNLINGPQF